MVVGSGAAGMTAALAAAHHGLPVVVIEKTGRFGGSTARSGGGLWVPGNEVLRRAGVADTPEQARAYLAHVVDGCVTAARQQALLEHGPAMLSFVRAAHPGRLRLGAGLRRLLPGGPGRPGQGPQHRAGAAGRPGPRRRTGAPQPALPAGPARGDHHPGRLPLAEPGPPASPGHARQREGRGPDGPHPPAPAARAQHRPGAGRGPARGPGGQAGAGLAGHPDDRPAPGGRPGRRGGR